MCCGGLRWAADGQWRAHPHCTAYSVPNCWGIGTLIEERRSSFAELATLAADDPSSVTGRPVSPPRTFY